MDRSVNAAVRRIQTGALALQTYLAESLYEEALPRKTFRLELTPKGDPKVRKGRPMKIFRLALTPKGDPRVREGRSRKRLKPKLISIYLRVKLVSDFSSKTWLGCLQG